MEYEVEMNKQSKRSAQSYFPTRYEDADIDSFYHDKSRVLDYQHNSDDAKIDAYYDLPLLLPCLKYVQPYTNYWCKSPYESLEEDTNYIVDDKLLAVEQGTNDHTNSNTPFTPNPQSKDGELSSEEDLDDWLKTKMEKHMCGQEKENEEDSLIAILKSLVCECKAVYANKGAQIETSLNGTYKVQGVSFIAKDDFQDEDCILQEPFHVIGSFNLYAMADLRASVNVMLESIFEHLKLVNLKKIDLLVEMGDMKRKAPLGLVENILVKIDNFLFPFDFMIVDMMGKPKETMILGRPFLATIHAHIDVFNREISLGIREDRVLFDMDGGVYHSKIPIEKVYMANSTPDEEHFNPLKIEDDIFSYESPTCLLFEQ
ncbi:phospholipase-like protein [Tanacetum coccineum]